MNFWRIEGYVFGSGGGKGTHFQKWVGSHLFMEQASLFSWWMHKLKSYPPHYLGLRSLVMSCYKNRAEKSCVSMEDNQTKLNIFGLREPMTANRRGTVQLNKPQGSLPPWRVEARSNFCSIPGRATGKVALIDWEGRWGLYSFGG